jgi:hypothetical protein
VPPRPATGSADPGMSGTSPQMPTQGMVRYLTYEKRIMTPASTGRNGSRVGLSYRKRSRRGRRHRS